MKGLDALECSLKLYKMVESAGNDNGFNLNEAWKYHETIKQALLELKQIKEAKPSEALKCVGVLKEDDCITTLVQGKALETIRQYILKAQEQEKALEIIKKKNVNIGLVNVLGSVEQYNQTYVYDNMLNVKWCLTQEEFELLKKVFYEMV